MNIKYLLLLLTIAFALSGSNTMPATAAPGGVGPVPRISTDDERMRTVLATMNDVPIVFYGKLEDGDGNAVAGAAITGRIAVNNGVREGVDIVNTTSDAQGLFRLEGKGASLGVIPRKAGYVIASWGTLFKYSLLEDTPYVSNPEHPGIIKMWKLRGAEVLVGLQQIHQVHLLNRPLYIDLLSKKIVPEGGDLEITVSRPEGVVSSRSHPDWGIQIAAVNGGIIKTTDMDAKFTYAAPEAGYGPSCTLKSSMTDHSWSRVVDGTFFVKSRDGQMYSKVWLAFGINPNPDDAISIEIRGAANANGSRNWEPNPTQ